MNEKLLQQIKSENLVHREPVQLRGGEKSDFYVDIKKGFGNPEILDALADEMSERIDESTTVIAASGYGGIPLASVIAAKMKKKLTLVRNTEKNHGTGGLIDGYVPGFTDKVSIVDDVFTTGSSLRGTIEALTSTEAEINGCYVVIKRGNGELGADLDFLFEADELL